MPAAIDLTGQRFGRLVAVSPTPRRKKQGHILWLCQCDCGGTKEAPVAFLRNGAIRSCGCLNREHIQRVANSPKTKQAVSVATTKRNLKHGHSFRGAKTRVYNIWTGLAYRTKYKAGPVCERWRNSFEAFLADMGEPPTPKHTIDRLDNSKGYEPGNCRWATMKEQQNNRTNNRLITHDGRAMTLMQWAEETGIHRKTIAQRLDRLGWSIHEALTRAASPLPRR